MTMQSANWAKREDHARIYAMRIKHLTSHFIHFGLLYGIGRGRIQGVCIMAQLKLFAFLSNILYYKGVKLGT